MNANFVNELKGGKRDYIYNIDVIQMHAKHEQNYLSPQFENFERGTTGQTIQGERAGAAAT